MPFEQPAVPGGHACVLRGQHDAASPARENFSAANELDQDIVELTDDFTLLKGQHTITIGTHNEFFKFRNLFIRDTFGTYRFTSLDLFEQGLAQQYDRSFSATSDPLQAAQFRVRQWGFYAGDQWRVRRDFTLTYGAAHGRADFPDKPTANPVARRELRLSPPTWCRATCSGRRASASTGR